MIIFYIIVYQNVWSNLTPHHQPPHFSLDVSKYRDPVSLDWSYAVVAMPQEKVCPACNTCSTNFKGFGICQIPYIARFLL